MWLDLAWRRRIPIAVDATALGAGSYTRDVQVTVPPWLAFFWDKVESDGHDIRITEPDGRTLLTYERTTWTYASNVAALEIQNVSVEGGAMHLLWLYFQNPAASDGETTFTLGTAISGYIEDLAAAASDRLVLGRPEAVGATVPGQAFQKDPDEEVDILWAVQPLLQNLLHQQEGSRAGEELDYVESIHVWDSVPADQTGMYDASKTRFLVTEKGALVVRTFLKAGTSGTNYTPEIVIQTTEDREHRPRCKAAVQRVSA